LIKVFFKKVEKQEQLIGAEDLGQRSNKVEKWHPKIVILTFLFNPKSKPLISRV